jgi:hypothetical protein
MNEDQPGLLRMRCVEKRLRVEKRLHKQWPPDKPFCI